MCVFQVRVSPHFAIASSPAGSSVWWMLRRAVFFNERGGEADLDQQSGSEEVRERILRSAIRSWLCPSAYESDREQLADFSSLHSCHTMICGDTLITRFGALTCNSGLERHILGMVVLLFTFMY